MSGKSKTSAQASQPIGEPFDFWRSPAVISANNFKYKSLSNWAFNISVGCSHACRFCYVPSASAIKQGRLLKDFGVKDPDEEWGDYSLLRP
jgi:tRNA A37 methylthiotransferase MiaB